MFLDNWLAKVVRESCFITTNEFTFTIKLLANAFIYKTIYLINRLFALKSSKQVDILQSGKNQFRQTHSIHFPNCVSYAGSGKFSF